MVSWRIAAGCCTGFSLPRTAAFRPAQSVGFPAWLTPRGYPDRPQRYRFRGSTTQPISSLHPASYTPLRPCRLSSPSTSGTEMHVGSLLTCRPRFSQVGLGAVHTRHDPHPLGNNDSFQGSVDASYVMTFSSPKVSDLSRHEHALVRPDLGPAAVGGSPILAA